MGTGETTPPEITESGSSNSYGDGNNPLEGLRILVVDDNEDELHSLEPGLRSLGSQVTCLNQNEATSLFRENSLKFDVVLAKVDWQIGFEFVEYVWRKMNIPIIVISSVEDRNLIIEAINHGAYFVLVRPVRINKLQRIWPFVLAHRRWALLRNQESGSGEDRDQYSRTEEGKRGWKRSESDSEEVNQPHSHGYPMKKSRLVWTDELKRRFDAILELFGDKKVTPKRIVELMNEPELTTFNISSHLQKYRLGLKKAKKAAAAASAQRGKKNSESSDTVNSNAKRRRVGNNEPIQINTRDIAGQTVGHFGVENLERRSRHVSYDPISSVPRVRETAKDGGCSWQRRRREDRPEAIGIEQNNGTEDPVGNVSPSVNKSPKDSTALALGIPIQRADTNQPQDDRRGRGGLRMRMKRPS